MSSIVVEPAPERAAVLPAGAAVPAVGTDLSLFVEPLGDGRARMDFAVDGITCAACMPVIEQGLSRVPGIESARVNLTHASSSASARWGSAPSPSTPRPSRARRPARRASCSSASASPASP